MYEYLEPIRPEETERAKLLLTEMRRWLASLPTEDVKHHRYNVALDAVNQAIIETRRYLRHRREGGDRDAETEARLSHLWSDAASRIQPYDANLANLCWVKGNGWADEAAWEAPENRDLPIRVDQMLQQIRTLAENPPPRDLPSWFPVAGVIFTLFTLLSLFYLLLAPHDIPAGRHVIFDVWVAFCLAASVSFLGGTAKAQGRLPWLGASPIQFAAVGGVAVFFIAFVLLYSVYH